MVENGKWEKLENGKSWKRKKLEKEKAGKGRKWKRKKMGKGRKWEKEENGKGRKWKRKKMESKKVLTLCRDSDKIPLNGKTVPAMKAEKRMEDETMAIISTEWRKQIKAMEEEAEARAYGKIIGALVNEGLANYGQILIGPQKLQKALRKVVLPELIRQDGLKSTGGAGKYNDIAQRMLYHINRDTSMEIIDLRCRPLSMADITVVIDTTDKRTAEAMDGKARVGVEQKTGAGALAQTEDELISWKMLARACDEGRLICWFPFSIPNWQEGNLDTLDDVPYFFGTYDMLFSTLYQYREDIRTWLKVCGNAVNFQNVTTSGKKIAFLEEACEEGWNWPLFRDWGRIRTK